MYKQTNKTNMKHETETPSLDRLQNDRLKEIRDIEDRLFYEGRTMSSEEHSNLVSKMNYLTRKFLYPFDCQNP